MFSLTLRAKILFFFTGFFFCLSCFAEGDEQNSPVILAAYQAWHGLPSHSQAWDGHSPYDSTDPDVISRHIRQAKEQGINGFVVDWYGPKTEAEVANNEDREFIDQATAELLRQAEGQDFYIAIMYDEGTVKAVETDAAAYHSRAESDIAHILQYVSSPAYLRINDKPALFVFPYPEVDNHIDWSVIRNLFGDSITLLDKDPNPDDPDHDALFDGFYAWVQPTHDCSNWGEEYLGWFYPTMNTCQYSDKVAIGGIWPGFDDLLVSDIPGWGDNRCISRGNGNTWNETWNIANEYNPPFVMIETWNDFEEGTDVEFGVEMIVDMEKPYPDLLPRSSPLKVIWNSGSAVVQVYKDGNLEYDVSYDSPDAVLFLESDMRHDI